MVSAPITLSALGTPLTIFSLRRYPKMLTFQIMHVCFCENFSPNSVVKEYPLCFQRFHLRFSARIRSNPCATKIVMISNQNTLITHHRWNRFLFSPISQHYPNTHKAKKFIWKLYFFLFAHDRSSNKIFSHLVAKGLVITLNWSFCMKTRTWNSLLHQPESIDNKYISTFTFS